MIRATLFSALISLVTYNSFAASKHVYASASGTGSGDTWTDAYTTFAAAETGCARGDTIYVAEGTYAGNVWDKAVSGTSVITIQRATTSSHGSATGWADLIGDGLILITNGMDFTTSYWKLLGTQGSYSRTSNATNSPYGFVIDVVSSEDIATGIYSGASECEISGCEMIGVSGNTNWTYVSAQYGTYFDASTNCTFRSNLLHGFDTMVYFGTPGGGTYRSTGIVVEDNTFHTALALAPAHCNIVYCTGTTNFIYRRNYAFNYSDEAFFVTGFQISPVNVQAHNNIFSALGGVGSLGSPRAIELRQDYAYTNIYIHNNTAISLGNGFSDRTGETGGTCSGCTATNNLSYASGNSWGSVAQGNNTDDSTDRFVNRTGFNFALSSALAGSAMASQFNTDIDGVTHGIDGTTDRGAIEFNGGTTYRGFSFGPGVKLIGAGRLAQ